MKSRVSTPVLSSVNLFLNFTNVFFLNFTCFFFFFFFKFGYIRRAYKYRLKLWWILVQNTRGDRQIREFRSWVFFSHLYRVVGMEFRGLVHEWMEVVIYFWLYVSGIRWYIHNMRQEPITKLLFICVLLMSALDLWNPVAQQLLWFQKTA